MAEINYIYVEPNSHFYTDIEQLLQTLRFPIYKGQDLVEYLITGEVVNSYLTDDNIYKMD